MQTKTRITARVFRSRKRLIAALPHRAVVAEIGVQRGNFSDVILRKARPQKLHLVDCWEEYHANLQYPHDGCPGDQHQHDTNFEHVQDRFAEQIASGQVVLQREYSLPAIESFPDAYLDWVFLDANHSYEAVSRELAALLPKMKPGGVIAGHDYIDTPFWREQNFGVVQAVDEFCAMHGWQLIGRTEGPGWDVDQTDNPSFALRRSDQGSLWYGWESRLPFALPRRR